MSSSSTEDMPSDILLSYSHVDGHDVSTIEAGIRLALQRLAGTEIRIWSDREPPSIGGVSDVVQHALERSAVEIAFLSASFFKSSHCRDEWRYFVERERRLHSIGALPPDEGLIVPVKLSSWDSMIHVGPDEQEFVNEVQSRAWRSLESLSPDDPKFVSAINDIAEAVLRILRVFETLPTSRPNDKLTSPQLRRLTPRAIRTTFRRLFDSLRKPLTPSREIQLLTTIFADQEPEDITTSEMALLVGSLSKLRDGARKQLTADDYEKLVADLRPAKMRPQRQAALSKKPPKLADYIAADGWTLVDKLQYGRYVNALCAFITDPRTIAPLCISVQAPWGGGKTSLMRMVQLRLDRKALEYDNPDALKAYDEDEAAKDGVRLEAPEDSVKELQRQATETLGDLGIGEVLNVIDAWKKAPYTPVDAHLEVANQSRSTCVTIWFNAWKYQGTNQVWAGLADAIISQITRRMGMREREKFFLKLRLSRIDAGKVRDRIYDRIYHLAMQRVGPWVIAWASGAIASLLTTLVGIAAHATWAPYGGTIATIAACGGFLNGIIGYFGAKKSVSSEKATATLSDLMTMPSYETEVGFQHKVDADLRRVLALVRETYWPIVIFIDDLDRSSPTNVAQVMEAVNLFLAGEFARCIFVMGMDSEMVAASLDVAHKDVISALPQDARTPVGWRFMDKFVQLPFVIPPVGAADVVSLSTSLATTPERQDLIRKAVLRAIAEGGEVTAERAEVHVREAGLAMEDIPSVLSQTSKIREASAQESNIAEFDDDRDDVRETVAQGLQYFAGNPREIKRFLNAFRLHVFLWGDKVTSEGPTKLSLQDIMRWTVFMMKWPDTMRWIRRAPRILHEVPGGDQQAPLLQENDRRAHIANRLKQLEDLSASASSLEAWAGALRGAGIPDATRWLKDEELFRFLTEPLAKPGRPLSEGVGEGLW